MYAYAARSGRLCTSSSPSVFRKEEGHAFDLWWRRLISLGHQYRLFLMPIVTLVQPILGVALALTLLIQGYVSVRVGILEARSQRDLGIAGVVGAVLATRGAAWALRPVSSSAF